MTSLARSLLSSPLLVTFLVALALGGASAVAAAPIGPPPNAASTVEWDAAQGHLSLRYHGTLIFDGKIHAENANGQPAAGVGVKLESIESKDSKDKVEQHLKFSPGNPQDGVKLVLLATAAGSGEAFPAETQGSAQRRFPLVRNSVGLSRNLRNNALYDRHWDWLLVGPVDGATRIQPKTVSKEGVTLAWESRGGTFELVFRPRYYQKHREISRFEPWTYQVWKDSVTGYCTWWAYRGDFSQQKLDEIVGVFAEKKLPDFGFRYLQIDDSYQTGNGSCPQNWLTWNGKFPAGADYALGKIKAAGMKGGIWVHRVNRPGDPHVADIAKEHPDWFVRKADGSIVGDSGFYTLDTKNQAAIEGMVRPTYRELKKQGWDYVKIDGAGDLLGAYKSKTCADHFTRIHSTPEESLRDWDRVARAELGPNVYILNCWGTGTGLDVVGMVDGCRLAGDGFQPETLANTQTYEGVLWRNDPDHCDILGNWLMDQNAMMKVFGTKEPVSARSIVRPAICSIAGSVLMVSDKAEVYKDDRNIEGMKRSAPVLATVPGQMFDAGHNSDTWWLQEIDRPFDHWSVLTRIQWAEKREKEWVFDMKGLPQQEVKFADLGLEADREYVVFEFWSQQFLGKFKGSFTAPAMDAGTAMDVFAIREARPHPWVISTTRHISQDGVSLTEEKWDAADNILTGKSDVVAGDPYVMTVHLPKGFRVQTALVAGEKSEVANQQEAATIRILPSATRTIEWKIKFSE